MTVFEQNAQTSRGMVVLPSQALLSPLTIARASVSSAVPGDSEAVRPGGHHGNKHTRVNTHQQCKQFK